jgi:integrase
MTVAKAEAIQAARAALKSAGIAAGKIEAALHALGLAPKPKRAKTLTNTMQVKAAPIGVHRIGGGGAKGLYLKKSGAKTGAYFFRFRYGDKRRSMGLGSIDEISLADAISKAGELTRQRKTVDPIEARRQEKIDKQLVKEADATAAKKRVTFAQAAKTYFDTNAPKWKHPGARAGWWNPIEKYAFPVLGHLALNDIEAAHVAAAMDAAVAARAPVMAKKIRAQIEQVIKLGVALGQRDATKKNPAEREAVALITKLGKTKTQHYRRIDLDAAPAAFQRLKELAATPAPAGVTRGPVPTTDIACAAWVFMIATAARPSEALKAKWSEINLAKSLWTLPDERMKGNKEHAVPLSSAALWALELMKAKRISDAVFPGRGGAPLADTSFATAPKKAGIDAGAPHSWRSVWRDWAFEIGRIDRELAEAQLAHSLGAVEKAYRRGSAVEARRPAVEAYAAWLEGDGAKVVAFPKRAS